jgi:hypothetical protein
MDSASSHPKKLEENKNCMSVIRKAFDAMTRTRLVKTGCEIHYIFCIVSLDYGSEWDYVLLVASCV